MKGGRWTENMKAEAFVRNNGYKSRREFRGVTQRKGIRAIMKLALSLINVE